MSETQNTEQIAFVTVHAWKANIEHAYDKDIEMWATQPEKQEMLEPLWAKGKRIYIIYTTTLKDGGTRILGLAHMTSGFILPSHEWPDPRGSYDKAPCFKIAWIVKGLDWRESAVYGLDHTEFLTPHLIGMAALKQMLENERVVPEDNEYVALARKLFPRRQLQKTLDFMLGVQKKVDKDERRDRSPRRGKK